MIPATISRTTAGIRNRGDSPMSSGAPAAMGDNEQATEGDIGHEAPSGKAERVLRRLTDAGSRYARASTALRPGLDRSPQTDTSPKTDMPHQNDTCTWFM